MKAGFTTNMVGESRDNVDVLLIFQNLQADYTAVSTSLLFELVLIQRAIANSSSVTAIPSSPLNPNIAFVPAPLRPPTENHFWRRDVYLSSNRIGSYDLRAYCMNYWHPSYTDDLDTLEAVLYHIYVSHIDEHASKKLADYHGRFVLVNRDTRELVREFDKKILVQEDPTMQERCLKKDPAKSPKGKRLTMSHL
ncbi:hypothetical protein ARMGADRAFT_1038097 [Armillaria gallica]|uniref:Uncharacterized protein n=1 Tax=Armillaria gallica TaxID=47427 RepID=A0A2H3CJ41_ARMGA|nr:hypothetical protein ARMGADRAFT_1038097 [Armillaria gallica]